MDSYYNLSKMAREPDPELKKAFAELQEKMMDTSVKMALLDVQVEKLKRNKHRADLTIKEITALPQDTKTYQAVGRMFILDEMDSVKKDLENRISSADEKIKTLENNKAYLQRNVKESENNLREMVQQRQNRDTAN